MGTCLATQEQACVDAYSTSHPSFLRRPSHVTTAAHLACPAGAAWRRTGCERSSRLQTPAAGPPAAAAPRRPSSGARRRRAPPRQSASAAAACRRTSQTLPPMRWCTCGHGAGAGGAAVAACLRNARLLKAEQVGANAEATQRCLAGATQLQVQQGAPHRGEAVCPCAQRHGVAALLPWELKEAGGAPAAEGTAYRRVELWG